MRRLRSRIALSCCFGLAGSIATIAFAGCGSKGGGTGFTGSSFQEPHPTTGDGSASDDSGDTNPFGDGGTISITLDGDVPDRAPPPASCRLPGLWCYQTTSCTTSLSGTVFDPAGKVPLSNVVVYVPADPSKPLETITTGTKSCSTCTTQIDNYMALAVTDVNGHFKMTGVPATTAVPVVVQVGKWRRKVTLASVTGCTTKGSTKDNPVSDGTLRLPRSRSEGDIPQMAVATGGADDLGCFLKEMGLDSSEYGPPNMGQRLDVYQGVGGPGLTTGTAGNCTAAGCPLWASKMALEYYDIVLLACEGGENAQTKPAASLTAMHDWLSEGGKVFATHFHYYWFNHGPADFQNVATWLGSSAGADMGTYTIDTSFNRGQVFDNWLTSPGVAAATGGSITLNSVAESVGAVSSNATRWIYGPPGLQSLFKPDAGGDQTKYLSFLTPIGGNKVMTDAGESTVYCGKAVFSDLHTSGSPSNDVPGSCPTTGLTAQQKALEYLFFDLAACVAPENVPPPTPPPNPPPPPPPPM
jgi:hypothetical protein